MKYINKEIILQKFNEQGFVKLKNFFPKNKIKKIKKDLLNFLKKKRSQDKKNFIHYTKNEKLINSVHNLKWPGLKKYQKNKEIIQIIKLLLKENIKNFGAEVFAKPAKFGMAVPIHQDNYYWNIKNSKGLTVWIALDKSSNKNGAIFYFKKTHKIGLLKHEPSYIPGSSQKIIKLKTLKKYKKITPSLDPGDILIHHCLVVHGSNKNLSNKSRTGLTMRYIARSGKINRIAKKKYRISLKKQLILRKKAS